ncbi:MAG: hypothetical protein KME21_16795 [Desmonostoc vinosum HA7617-LM4]|jgi:hypothetical protein|nr:hypothetical protein [Desmonostoc vinosum HA7617-LM4]
MFYIHLVQKRWDKSKRKFVSLTSEASEVEDTNKKSSKFAHTKATDYIRNTQVSYYLERRLFC